VEHLQERDERHDLDDRRRREVATGEDDFRVIAAGLGETARKANVHAWGRSQ